MTSQRLNIEDREKPEGAETEGWAGIWGRFFWESSLRLWVIGRGGLLPLVMDVDALKLPCGF